MHELRCVSRMTERTLDAFDLVVVRGVTPSVAAKELGLSVSDVYVAKHRVTKHLSALVTRLERESAALELAMNRSS